MSFELSPLPYSYDSLAPHMSKESLEFHHDKHHKTYVDNLNKLVPSTAYETMDLESIVKSSSGPVFNNAAQAWNHEFFWNCLSPEGGGEPQGLLLQAINESFGSFAAFKIAFADAAIKQFGSGWGWLVKNKAGKLEITSTSNAGNPLTDGNTPILTCDVWEHAYYIDYRNKRPDFLAAYWKLDNWKFAAQNFS